jgi:hypothetical protein
LLSLLLLFVTSSFGCVVDSVLFSGFATLSGLLSTTGAVNSNIIVLFLIFAISVLAPMLCDAIISLELVPLVSHFNPLLLRHA